MIRSSCHVRTMNFVGANPTWASTRLGTSRRLLGVLPVLALAFLLRACGTSSPSTAGPTTAPPTTTPVGPRRRGQARPPSPSTPSARPAMASRPVPEGAAAGRPGQPLALPVRALAVSVGRFDTDQAPAEQSGPVPEGLPGLRRRPINGGLRGRTRRARRPRLIRNCLQIHGAVHRRHQGTVVNPGFSPEGRSRVADPGWRPPASANRRSSSAHRSVPPRTRC